ncbi:MAG: DUF4440 domain-containing protein [Pseudomonadota bacterium]
MRNRCALGVIGLCLVFASPGGQASQDSTEEAVRAFMNTYLETFDSGHANQITAQYTAPMMMLAPNGDVRTYETQKNIRRTVKKWKRYLNHNGYDRSEWVSLNVRALSDDTAVASTVFDRYDTSGNVFQRGAATYTLRREDDQWKIWLIHIHNPDRVLAFN